MTIWPLNTVDPSAVPNMNINIIRFRKKASNFARMVMESALKVAKGDKK